MILKNDKLLIQIQFSGLVIRQVKQYKLKQELSEDNIAFFRNVVWAPQMTLQQSLSTLSCFQLP